MWYFTLTRVLVSVRNYESTDFVAVLRWRSLRQLFALTDGVDKTPDSKQDEISEELQEFGNCQHSEAEPQAEHSTKIRNVLCHLYIVSSAKRK